MRARKNIKRVLSGALFFPFTILLFAPLDNYLLSTETYIFSAANVLSVFVLLFAVGFVAIFLLLFFVPVSVRKYIVTVLFVINAIFYIHGNFLDNNYGFLNGEAIDWSADLARRNVSIAVIAVCLIVTVALVIIFRKKDFEKLLLLIALICMGMQTTSCVAQMAVQGINPFVIKPRTAFTKDGMFQLSKTDNTLIFVVDTLDTDIMNEYLQTYDPLGTEFKDFVFYDNCISISGATALSVPFMLTDELYMHDQPRKEYGIQAWSNSELMQALETRDYDTRIFAASNVIAYNADVLDCDIKNVQSTDGLIKDIGAFVKSYSKLIAFRYMPQPLKRFFLDDSSDINSESLFGMDDSFSVNDPQFYIDYRSTGLSAEIEQPVFRFYHLSGAHPPYILGSDAQKVKNGTQLEQLRGVFRIIDDYLHELKELGIYDTANIVILGDHGYYGSRTRTAVLIKRAETDADFLRNSAPLSFRSSLKNTLLELVGAESSGSSFFHPNETDTRTAWTTAIYKTDRLAKTFVTFEVKIDEDQDTKGYTYRFTGNTSPPAEAGLNYTLGDSITTDFFANCITSVNTYRQDGLTEFWGPSVMIPLELDKKPDGNLKLIIEYVLLENYPGTVRLNVNGCDVGTAKINTVQNELEFLIPKEFIKEKTLVLQLYFDGISTCGEKFPHNIRAALIRSLRVEKAGTSLNGTPLSQEKMFLSFSETVNAEVIDGVLEMGRDSGARSWYVNYPAGTYRISINGTGIDTVEMRPIYFTEDDGNIEPEVHVEEHTESSYIQYFTLEENAEAVTIMLWSAQGKVKVDQMCVERVL